MELLKLLLEFVKELLVEHLSLSVSLKMAIFEKKIQVCITGYSCRSFNISVVKHLTNIK